MEERKYDVAFSFLAQDEPLAAQLNDLLAERFVSFLYSKQQEELAGSDGEVAFNNVFTREARVVVVLYRPGWGQSPWTRIEETAIRNRAYHDGYDFALFIPLDSPPSVPDWLPKTQLWVGLERWGIAGAASVIEARVQQSGGVTRPETAIDRAARLARDMEREEQRRSFLASDQGVEAATEYLNALFDEVERITGQMAEKNGAFTFRLERTARKLVAYLGGLSLTVAWSLQWGNSLDHSTLYVKMWKGAVSLQWQGPDRQELNSWPYDFDRLPSGVMGWRARDGGKRFFPGVSLADHFLKQFLEGITTKR